MCDNILDAALKESVNIIKYVSLYVKIFFDNMFCIFLHVYKYIYTHGTRLSRYFIMISAPVLNTPIMQFI